MNIGPEAKEISKKLPTGKPFVLLVPMDTGILDQLERVMQAHLSKNSAKVNTIRFSLQEGASKQVLTKQVNSAINHIKQSVMQFSLFSEANLYIIRTLPGGCCTSDIKPLLDLVNETNGIILVMDQVRSSKSLIEHVKKSRGFVVSLRNVAKRQAQSIVRAAARQYGIGLTDDAINTLVDLIGTDRGYLTKAVESLSQTYGQGKRLTAEHCAKLVSRRSRTMPWDLTDAVGNRDLVRALRYVNLLLEESGYDAFRVFATLMNHVRKLLAAQAFLMDSDPVASLVKKMRLSPFPARKLVEQARNFTTNELTAFLARGPEMEQQVKTGGRALPALLLFVTQLIVKSRH